MAQGALDCRAINLAGPFQLCRVTHKRYQGLQIEEKMRRLNRSRISASRTTKYGWQTPSSLSLEVATKIPKCVSTFFHCKPFCDGDNLLQADILSCDGHPPVSVYIDPASTEQTWNGGNASSILAPLQVQTDPVPPSSACQRSLTQIPKQLLDRVPTRLLTPSFK